MDHKPLPDYCIPNRPLEALDGAVVHYFSAKNVDPDNAFNMHACLDLFKDLNRPRSERESYMREDSWPSSRMYASAHVLIGRTGTVWKLVDFEQQAYHAGASILNGRQACNRWTLASSSSAISPPASAGSNIKPSPSSFSRWRAITGCPETMWQVTTACAGRPYRRAHRPRRNTTPAGDSMATATISTGIISAS